MPAKWRPIISRIALLTVLGASLPLLDGPAHGADDNTATVEPQRLDAVLTNPDMGFAHFHMGWHVESSGLSPEEAAERRADGWYTVSELRIE